MAYKNLNDPILFPLNFYQIIANIKPPLPFQPQINEIRIPINPSKQLTFSWLSYLSYNRKGEI